MKTSRGFTLIEIIVTIVVLAIAATAVVSYLGTSFTRSGAPAGQVQRQYLLVQQMETFTSHYRYEITTNADFNLAAFKTNFIDGQPFVDASKTGIMSMVSGTYITRPFLRVTLTDGEQTLMSIFTQ